MIFIFIIVAICLTVFWLELKFYLIRRKMKNIPGPLVLPILGNALIASGSCADILYKAFDLWYKYGQDTFRIWVCYSLNFIVTSAEDVEYILTSKTLTRKSFLYEVLYPWLGEGLITSSGLKWKQHRKIITPSFHFQVLQDFHEVMNLNSNKFMEKLKEASKGDKIFDIQEAAVYFALDVICETAMGVNINCMDNPDSELATAFQRMSGYMYKLNFDPLRRCKYTAIFFRNFYTYCRDLKILRNFTHQIIEKRVKAYNLEAATRNKNDDKEFGKGKLVFLDNLLSSTIDGRPLSNQELYEEVSTFIFAGHDSTASAIAFTTYLLSRHQDVQQKLYEEQQQMLQGDMKRDATIQELSDMKYLDLVFKEAQRLYPSVPVISRMMEEEGVINGKVIPKNATVALFLMAMGYNEKYFPDPYRFIPERFELANRADKNPFEYVPFSFGPRNCIGQKFAQLEVKTVVSKIVRHFEILPALDELVSTDGYVRTFFGPYAKNKVRHKYDPVLETVITLKSENGVFVRLKPRN